MKIKGSSPTKPPARTGGVKAAGKSAEPTATPITDQISIAGIPEAELTPRVREALFSLMDEVRVLRAELAAAKSEMTSLRTLAETDPLLGVLNRRAFVRELNRALALAERYDAPASLVFIDLNDLKKINDEHGHGAGDEALAYIAKILGDNIRDTDVLGRLGGDEFGLILTHADEAIANSKSEMLRALVAAAPIELGGVSMQLDIACGAVSLGKAGSADEALEAADAKMYARKRRSKGQG